MATTRSGLWIVFRGLLSDVCGSAADVGSSVSSFYLSFFVFFLGGEVG